MATQAKYDEGEDFEFPDEKEEKAKAKAKAKDDDFEVDIEDDTPVADRGRKPSKEPVEDPTEDELASYDEKVQNRIKKFTRGYHDERRAKEQALREREAAESFARQVFDENKKLKEQLSVGSKAYVETAKSAAEAELEAAREKYRKAYETADPDALVKAQEDIARATVKAERAGHLQPVEMEDDKEFRIPQSQQEQEAPRVSRRTQSWLDNNSDWFGKDDEMTMAAMGLDKKFQKQYGPDYVGTPEYFQAIDKTMRKRFPEYFEDAQSDEDDEPPRKKRAEPADEDEPPRRASKTATVVAPASRSTPPSRVRLKASEAAIARRLGVPLEEYAKQVAKLERS
jgi:hypothetical protein